MSKVWGWLVVTSCTTAMLTDQRAAAQLLQGGQGAVELVLKLAGSMVLWSGVMEILNRTGDVARLGRLLSRVLAPLFGGLTDGACWSAMGMNMAANMLGLGNAATPAGIRAAQLLEKQGEAGLRALTMLLVLNNSGLQLLPTTVMTLRSTAGAANPADVWLPGVVASGAATLCAVMLMGLINRGGLRRG